MTLGSQWGARCLQSGQMATSECAAQHTQTVTQTPRHLRRRRHMLHVVPELLVHGAAHGFHADEVEVGGRVVEVVLVPAQLAIAQHHHHHLARNCRKGFHVHSSKM